MKIATTIVFAVMVAVLLGTGSANAQPSIAVYFDDINTESAVCPGPVLDTLYVVAQNFGAFYTGLEYQIDYSGVGAYMFWLSDLKTPGNPGGQAGVTLGNSASGISMGFALPQNGFFPQIVHWVLVQWTCNSCNGQGNLVVKGHPLFNPASPQWTSWPDNALFPAIGLTATVCASVPTEETTWGNVKALYTE